MSARKKPAVSTQILPRYRMYRGKDIVLGPGKAELLEHIADTGSISESARLMGMSYNRAWLHVKIMNEAFREPLVHSSRGGAGHGGASLTETGLVALKLYRQMEQEATQATAETQLQLSSLIRA